MKRNLPSVKKCIENAKKEGFNRSDILVLLAHVLHTSKEFLYTHPERVLSSQQVRLWRRFLKKRKKALPVAYIVGEKEFYSLAFRVNRAVLIPRPETELLVDILRSKRPKSVLDIGTGSGNIAIAVQYHLPSVKVIAVDSSRSALRLAKQNELKILGKQTIRFMRSDYFANLNGIRVECIVSNPPYVKRHDLSSLQKEIYKWEPHKALNGGEDGLDAYRKILKNAGSYLEKKGELLLEVSGEIMDGLRRLAENYGWKILDIMKDYAGIPRVVVLVLKGRGCL